MCSFCLFINVMFFYRDFFPSNSTKAELLVILLDHR